LNPVIVLDASVVVSLVLDLGSATKIAAQRVMRERSLHVPHLVDLEVAQVVRRLVRRLEVPPHAGASALLDLAQWRLVRHAHWPFLRRVFELRDSVTAYDAVYLALAETLGATLLTRDRALTGVRQSGARVDVLPNA
jgi:predicted nucleic acid-binding protein